MKSDVIIEVKVGYFCFAAWLKWKKIVEYTKCEVNWNLKLFLEVVQFSILF